jgi:hypothetical protein
LEEPRRRAEEAGKFYRDLAAQGMKVRVGMELSGQVRLKNCPTNQDSFAIVSVQELNPTHASSVTLDHDYYFEFPDKGEFG